MVQTFYEWEAFEMTETDFFRIARERLGTFGISVWRDASETQKPYKVCLIHLGREYEEAGNTLAYCLESLLSMLGIDRRFPTVLHEGRSDPPDPAPPEKQKSPQEG